MLSFIFLVVISNFYLTITNKELFFSNIPPEFDNFKILQLSDLHNKSYGKNYQYLLRKIQQLDFDLIVLTGDMINRYNKDFSRFYFLAEVLVTLAPTYFVVGNHELSLKPDKLQEFLIGLKAIGVIVLDNQSVTLKRNQVEIDLYGLNLRLRYYNNPHQKKIKKNPEYYQFNLNRLKDIFPELRDKFSILLAHTPAYFDVYQKYGFDLTLSGHVHGGAIYLPFFGGVLSSEKVFFPKYYAGLYFQKNSQLYISRGLGSGWGKARFLSLPEIVLLTLKLK